MKRLLILSMLLVPSVTFADRLGSLRSSADVLLTTQTPTGGSASGPTFAVQYTTDTTHFQGSSKFTTDGSSVTVSTMVVNGEAKVGSMTVTGNGTVGGGFDAREGGPASGLTSGQVVWADSTTHRLMIIPNNGNTYVQVLSSITPTVGDCSSWSEYGGLVDAGAPCGTGSSGGGSGTVNNGNAGNLGYYNVTGATIAPVSNTVVTASSITISENVQISTLAILSPAGTSANIGQGRPGFFDVSPTNLVNGTNIFTAGSSSQGDKLDIQSGTDAPILMTHGGATVGSVEVGQIANPNRIAAHGDFLHNYIDLRSTNTMQFHTDGGGTPGTLGDMMFWPGETLITNISTATGVTVYSTITVLSNPGRDPAGLVPTSIIASSGNPTYGAYYDPDFVQLYNSGNGRECIGFRQAGDSSGGLQPMSICRLGSLQEMTIGLKVVNGGNTGILDITSNGNFPQGSSVTVNGDLIMGAGDIEGPSIKNTIVSGISISSGIYIAPAGGMASVISGTTTLTSTMSVVLASCTTRGATPNAWITLTLPPVNNNGEEHFIYDIGSDSCSIRVQANPGDLIESTGTVPLNAQTQHASVHALTTGLWGSGPGGIQVTPWSVFTTQDDVGTFTVAVASQVTSCPIYIPAPVGFMGFRINRVSGNGLIGGSIVDAATGRYITGVSSMNVVVGGAVNYFSGGVTQLAPGYYRVLFSIPNTVTSISGSNTVNSNKMYCGTVGTSTSGMDLSGFTPTLPGTSSNGNYPAIDLLFSGGLQSF
jgi:hypothetical protein